MYNFVMLEDDRPPLPEGWTQRHENGRIYTFTEAGTPVCAAYNSHRRTYCKKYTCKGSNRCVNHGGKIAGSKNISSNKLKSSHNGNSQRRSEIHSAGRV